MTSADGLVEVRLLQVPVPLWSTSQQVSDELLREFALAAAQADDGDAHQLPARLTTLIDTLTSQFAGATTAQEQQLLEAAAEGRPVLDELVFRVPPEAAPASKVLGDMLDEADEYCRDGQHLLTLAAPEEVVAFRRWYLLAFIEQPQGAAPVPWPEYDGRWPT